MSETENKRRLLPGRTNEELAQTSLPLPDPATLDEEERAAFEYVAQRSERFFNSFKDGTEYRMTPLFQGLLQSPRLAAIWSGFGDFYQTSEARGSFSNRDRDVGLLSLIPLLTSAKTGQFLFSAVWVTWAVGTGVAPKDIKAILEGRVEDISPEDRQLFEFVRATATGGLSKQMFDALAGRWNVKTAIEFISFVTWRIGLLRTVQAHWDIQDLENDSAEAYKVLEEYINGERDPEDYNMASDWVKAPPASS
ncbi:MAG: hypothetical protein H6905_04455 [Hyphomicrobiales bacterium]|nr:hypothetical protein [Hyphomicrobiales bacterium]